MFSVLGILDGNNGVSRAGAVGAVADWLPSVYMTLGSVRNHTQISLVK